MWKLLSILTMVIIFTDAAEESLEAKKLKALEDIKEEAVDKQQQKEAESMGESLVKSYEFIIKAAPEAGRSAYIGCFKHDKSWRDKSAIRVNLASSTTVGACVEECWERRQRFASLWSGNHCWCVNIIRGLGEVEEAQCSTPCNGNRTQACGGTNRGSIYYTGYIEEPIYTHLTHKDISTAVQGCYLNNKYKGDCTVGVVTQRMSAPMCMDVCENHGFQFASISKKLRCCCDPHLKQFYKVQKGNCKMECPFAGVKYHCGDARGEYFSVYRTAIPLNVSAPLNDQIQKEAWMEPDIDVTNIRVLTG
ncbi:hypothetical protein BsWGS_06206 [Bradybaena similaris]